MVFNGRNTLKRAYLDARMARFNEQTPKTVQLTKEVENLKQALRDIEQCPGLCCRVCGEIAEAALRGDFDYKKH